MCPFPLILKSVTIVQQNVVYVVKNAPAKFSPVLLVLQGEFKKFMADLSQMNADVAHKPTLVLYFRLSVEDSMRRIKKRAEEEGREFEKEITEEYLRELDSMYEELYKDREDVIRLDSNMPPDEIKREVADQLETNAARFHRALVDKGCSQEEAEVLLMHMTSCFVNRIEPTLHAEGDHKANTRLNDPAICHDMTKTRPFLEKLLGEDLDEKDIVAGLKSFVEHYTANLGKQRHFLIVCDGNIGCGKTAFLDEIGNSQHLPSDVQIFREPVAKNVAHSWWSLMEKFYRDMKSGKGPAAVVELENAIWAHHRKIATQRESHVITERCCDSSLLVFCNALQKKGTLPEGPLVLTMRPDIPFFLCTV